MGGTSSALSVVFDTTNWEKAPMTKRIIYSLLRPHESRKNDTKFTFPHTFDSEDIDAVSSFTLNVSGDFAHDSVGIKARLNTEITCDLLWALVFNQIRFPTSYKGFNPQITLHERVREVLAIAEKRNQRVEIFKPVRENLASKVTGFQPSTFSLIVDNYEHIPFSVLVNILARARDDPLLPAMKISPYKNMDEIIAAENQKPEEALKKSKEVEAEPLFRAVDISLRALVTADTSSHTHVHEYDKLFDLLLDYPFEGTVTSSTSKFEGYNLLFYLADAFHRNRQLVSQQEDIEKLQKKCQDMLASFISSGKLVKKVLVSQRLPVSNHSPFEHACQFATADFLNEMLVVKLFNDEDFENSLKNVVNNRLPYYHIDKVASVLSLPVENRIPRAQKTVKDFPMNMDKELSDFLSKNQVI